MPLPVEQYDVMGSATGLPVEQSQAPVQMPTQTSGTVDRVINKLFRDDERRYQLWPEKIARDALNVIPEGMAGKIPAYEIVDGELRPSRAAIKGALDMSALAGTGGLGGVGAKAGEAVLGGGPFLRPALKYQDKIYKAPVGTHPSEHLEALPKELIPEFQRLAMTGDDISHYNFGYMNHKGQFLDRKSAMRYGIDEGLIDPQALRYGDELTSPVLKEMMLSADSAKEAVVLKALEDKGFNIKEPVYHESNKQFDKIKPQYGTTSWYTTDKNAIGNVGASATGKVATAYLKHKKLANREAYEKYGTDELIAKGYDGARLENDIVMFDPKNVKIHKWEDLK